MPSFLLYGLVVFCLMMGLPLLIVLQRLLGITLQYQTYQGHAFSAVPDHLKPLFLPSLQTLANLGFKPCAYVQIWEMFSAKLDPFGAIWLYHAEQKTYAQVSIRRTIEPFYPCNVEFYTFFQDRTALLTMTGGAFGILGEIPNTIVQDPYTAKTEDQWTAHCDRLTSLAAEKSAIGLAPPAFLKALEQHSRNYLDHLVTTKQIAPIPGTEEFHINWGAALKLTLKLRQGTPKAAAISVAKRSAAMADPALAVTIPVELEVASFHYMHHVEKGRSPRRFGLWIFLATLALFIVLLLPAMPFGGFFNPKTLGILLGVIFFHESGHFLAMRWFGYQDTSIFFIPLFGAAAAGRKENASLTEQFWVLLAGPLPGLVVGLGLAIGLAFMADEPAWLQETAWILIGLNLFNLLPIYPLDGGKIANLLWFSQFPYASVGFKILAAVLLGLLGLADPILLGLAVLVGLSIPAELRSSELDQKFRQRFPTEASHDREHLLHSIYDAIHQFGQGKHPFAERYRMAKDLLNRSQEVHATWLTRIVLSGFYALSLLGTVIGGVGIAIAPTVINLVKPEIALNKQLQEAEADLAKNPQDAQAYLRRGRAKIRLKDYPGALADLDRAIQLDPNFLEAYRTRSLLHRQMGNQPAAEADQKKVDQLIARQRFQSATKILQKDPKNVDALLNRAKARLTLGDFKRSIEDSTQAIQLAPDRALAYVLRGQAHDRAKNYKAALADANRAIQLDAQIPAAYELRATVRQKLGDQAGAEADRQKAAEISDRY